MSQSLLFLLHIPFFIHTTFLLDYCLTTLSFDTIRKAPEGKELCFSPFMSSLHPSNMPGKCWRLNKCSLRLKLKTMHYTYELKMARNFKAKDLISLIVWVTASILKGPRSPKKRANIYSSFFVSELLTLLSRLLELSKLQYLYLKEFSVYRKVCFSIFCGTNTQTSDIPTLWYWDLRPVTTHWK